MADENNLVEVLGRDELQKIRDDATLLASVPALNPTWQRAYLELADAADRLDAMIARITLYDCVPQSIQGEGCPLEIGTEAGWASDSGFNCEKPTI